MTDYCLLTCCSKIFSILSCFFKLLCKFVRQWQFFDAMSLWQHVVVHNIITNNLLLKFIYCDVVEVHFLLSVDAVFTKFLNGAK